VLCSVLRDSIAIRLYIHGYVHFVAEHPLLVERLIQCCLLVFKKH
jgi:hypothetical protein